METPRAKLSVSSWWPDDDAGGRERGCQALREVLDFCGLPSRMARRAAAHGNCRAACKTRGSSPSGKTRPLGMPLQFFDDVAMKRMTADLAAKRETAKEFAAENVAKKQVLEVQASGSSRTVKPELNIARH